MSEPDLCAMRAEAWEQQAAEVFQLVVEQCDSSTNPQLVCSLLQVSTACRKLLQQTRGQCHVMLNAADVQHCSKFVTWMQCHAGLVFTLALLEHVPSPLSTSLPPKPLPDIISNLLTMGINLCTLPAAAQQQVQGSTVLSPGPSAAAAAAAPLPLRLHTVVISNAACGQKDLSYVTVPLLDALGAAGIECLEVDVTSPQAEAAVAASISRLTSLKELVITLAEEDTGRPLTGVLCATLQPLTRLTRLDCLIASTAACQLPASLIELDLRSDPYQFRQQPSLERPEEAADAGEVQLFMAGNVADLSHLSALTSLTLRHKGVEAINPLKTSLPAHLSQLRVFGNVSILGLRHLRCAEVHAYQTCDCDILHQLAPLQHPWALELCVHFAPRPTTDCSCGMCQQCCEVEGATAYIDPEAAKAAYTVAADALGFSSHLTSLLVCDCNCSLWSKIPWCEAVTNLQGLQEVWIAGAVPTPTQLKHLAALPTLRRLELQDDCPPDSLAVNVLLRFTRLEELSMNCRRLTSTAVFAGICALSSLTSLRLHNWECKVQVCKEEIALLQPLQQLRVLHLDGLGSSLSAVVDDIRQLLPQLQELRSD